MKESIKKRTCRWRPAVSLGMAAAMIFSLTACGGSVSAGGRAADGEAAGKEASGNEPAAEKGEQTGDVTTLKAFTMGKEPSSGLDTFYQQLDALTVKDLGIKVRFDFIPWGDEKNKINLNIASGEYDLYVGGNFSDYKGMAAKNAFLDLKPLLNQAPDLVKHYCVVSDKTLESCEIDGKLYGIPQLAKSDNAVGANEGFLYREDLREAWGLPKIDSLETMEQYMYKAKDEYPESSVVMDNRIWSAVWNILTAGKYLEIDSYMNTPYTLVSVDDPYTALDRTKTPEYKTMLEYMKKWYQDGIIDHDILASTANEGNKIAELIKADKKVTATNSPAWSLGATISAINKNHPDWKMGWYDYTFGKGPAYIPSVCNSTCISINPKCKEPVKALKFIEKAHTDQAYYNLLRYGVEGENYKIENGMVSFEGIDTNDLKPAWSGVVDGYMEAEVKSENSYWQEQMDAMRVTPTEFSPIDGFIFNASGLSAETASLESVRTQYMMPLLCGVTQDMDADYGNVEAQLKKAGIDTYIGEMQKQLDEFKAKKSAE